MTTYYTTTVHVPLRGRPGKRIAKVCCQPCLERKQEKVAATREVAGTYMCEDCFTS